VQDSLRWRFITLAFYETKLPAISPANIEFPLLQVTISLLILMILNQSTMMATDANYSAKYPTLKLAILHERRVELAFEHHRWHDLTRFFTPT
jgi:hypothetical protein